MNRPSRLSYLEKKVSSAIAVITNTITALEVTTAEYETEKKLITNEIAELNYTADIVDAKITENKKLLDNFKKLLA